MPVSVIPLNGKSHLINYDNLKDSFIGFLGTKGTEATMFVFNNFPVPVLPEATIDLLVLICLHDYQGNYTRYPNMVGSFDYFRNSIIPITVCTQYETSQITIEENFLEVDGSEYDYEDEFTAIKFSFINFLDGKIKMSRNKLRIKPIQLLLNDHAKYVHRNYMVAKTLDSDLFFTILKQNPTEQFQSYSAWTKQEGYSLFKENAKMLNDAASNGSKFGYLTRRKIERIGSQLSNNSAIYEAIGKQPTIISGKAGTGKTAHLMHLLVRSLKDNKSVTFLTYNQLLTKDIAYLTKVVQNGLYAKWQSEGQDTSHFASATVQTLMGFIFKVSRNLGVLHLMTKERVKELELILNASLDYLVINLPELFQQNHKSIFKTNVDWNAAIEAIQNTKWEVEKKQYGISFIHYLQKQNKSITVDLYSSAKGFHSYKMSQLKEICYKNVFLRDYTGCLKNTLDLFRNTESFYEQFDVKTNYELLEAIMNLNARKGDDDLKNKLISLDLFKKRVKNVLKGRTTKERILMVDESQDCHNYERELFYEIFGPANVVASYGGKEQLIRFAEPCQWRFFKGKEIAIKIVGSGNKSYRIKQNILDFCNYISEKHEIDLKLKSFSEEDLGEIIFDFRPQSEINFGSIFSELLNKGLVNDCTPLESLLILDINNHDSSGAQFPGSSSAIVNEFGVLLDEDVTIYKDFDYLIELNKYTQYWVGAVADKQKLPFPFPNEVRIINYESCRGLEAWSVMCLNIDSFYYSQTKSNDAEIFLLHEGLILSSTQRAAMYAITWILMAATRAIDTLYLQMSNKENTLVKLCLEYANDNPEKCKVMGR